MARMSRARTVAGHLLLVSVLTSCGSAPAPSELTSAAPSLAASAPPPSDGSPPSSAPELTEPGLRAHIRPEALEAHLRALQDLADDPGAGSNRATGSPGFTASSAYVASVLADAGYDVTRQEFMIGDVVSSNLLVERAGGGSGVVMLGAHLDSVAVGPGMNDNGSGVAALLVLATALTELPAPSATVRFAFWGGEEGGPFGSQAYVDTLEPAALARIRAYLNVDMIGSPNAVTFVYDEPGAAPGSNALRNVIVGYFARHGLPWDPIDLEGDSDHGPFIAAGVPTGGLFAGGIEPVTEAQAARFGAVAGEPADACSHAACDTIENVDVATLKFMTDVIAAALVALAAATAG